MGTLVFLVVILLVAGTALVWFQRQTAARNRIALEDAQAEARRWTERLGGQVYNLDGGDNPAAKQAVADAAERYTAAGSQLDQARSVPQFQLATQTAMEGLYYVRAARTALGLDPGPELPNLAGQPGAGRVTEDRRVTVEGQQYAASPQPSAQTPNYYPGGVIAGRPVPQGWYSQPWWRTALIGGAWGVGSALLFDTLFQGMGGIPDGQTWASGYDNSWGGGGWDNGPGWGGGWDNGPGWGGDGGGNDWIAGGDDSGWGGGDFGGGDW